MTKEIQCPNVEEFYGVQWPVRHSDFGIPSDFVIRHSGLRIEVHGVFRNRRQRTSATTAFSQKAA